MRRSAVGLLALMSMLVGCVPSLEAREEFRRPVPADIPPLPAMVVLDASGSMKADDAPGVRFEAAQAAVRTLADALEPGHEIGLLAYGTGTGSSDEEAAEGCQDVSTVVPFGALDAPSFVAEVDDLAPSGYTPIGLALERAVESLPQDGERAVVLVSDGLDTCASEGLGPEPCELAEGLPEGVTVHAVGFKITGELEAREQLDCIAAATGGLSLDASNARLLRTRLLAAFDPGRAGNSLQPGEYRGVEPGMTVAEVRSVVEDLPDVATAGEVEVRYVDCTLIFRDGVVQRIVPTTDDVRTVDGVGVGDDVAEALDLYADGGSTPQVEGDTVALPADGAAGTGFEITFDGPVSAGVPTGSITRIVLCLCAPGGAPPVRVINPFDADGSVGSQWQVSDERGTRLAGGEGDVLTGGGFGPSPHGVGPDTYYLGASADSAHACWGMPQDAYAVLCMVDPWSTELRQLSLEAPLPRVQAADDAWPLGIELEDGSRWAARNGGAWGGRDDDLIPIYYCVDECPSTDLYVLADGSGTSTMLEEDDGWYVLVGEIGDIAKEYPAPKKVRVSEVRYIG
ncbi:vWA domain-containing protein [Aeromicrobium halocynthiae]|uniref:vWA domain-containing protein n=1 Tax=Aeromicrobium halocynthiae TaxID=560557 RepID=UPI0031D74CA3